MFDRFAALASTDHDELESFCSRDLFGENPERDRLNAINEDFFAVQQEEDLQQLNARWLTSHCGLVVTPPAAPTTPAPNPAPPVTAGTLDIDIDAAPPHNGWLLVTLTVNGHAIEIDASDVPNNPVEQLARALALCTQGEPAQVWWNMEPDGYFTCFTPHGDDVELRIDFAFASDKKRAQNVVTVSGKRAEVLMPFWKFTKQFQSRGFAEPHWPATDYGDLEAVKKRIAKG